MTIGNDNDADSGDEERLHVFDLPQIYRKPTADVLLDALHLLTKTPSGFSPEKAHPRPVADPAGVPRYLTSIISSPLDWIVDEAVRERIWSAASLRLSEQSGSNAAPNQTRSFRVTDDLCVRLYEPSLTGDNLGFKTWASSLLMSRRLLNLRNHIKLDVFEVLELGAGTGLVGVSAACLWEASITLTDLIDIVPNLAKNLLLNADLIAASGAQVQARVLDWSDNSAKPEQESEKFPVILVADPIYSPDHPRWLVETILRWIKRDDTSRLMIELPLREHYATERAQLNEMLGQGELSLISEGTETGYDDWHNMDGSSSEVHCWWGVWKPKSLGQ